ncbi:MAG: biopolymer transporter ExbD [Flavobacteriaceae bacterium]
MKSKRFIPEINAGSMADIAFLLLIFFLVATTIPNDKGIVRKLPPKCLTEDCSIPAKERNVFRIHLNKNDELFVNNKLLSFSELTEAIKTFVDNNGDGTCLYCKGESLEYYSENPKKAIISLNASGNSSYKNFIAVQVAITQAYLELRESYVLKSFNKNIAQLSENELIDLKNVYPILLTEATLK